MKKTILLSSITMCALCCFSGAEGIEVDTPQKPLEDSSAAPAAGESVLKNAREKALEIVNIIHTDLASWRKSSYTNIK